mgnify:CR=1 FL=1
MHGHPLGAGGGIEVVLVLVGMVDGAVLGLLVNLDLGMVRPKVAGIAGFGPPGLGDSEAMAAVAGGARTLAAVHVQPSHAHVGPGGGIQFALVVDGQHGPVAVVAAGFALVVRVHALVQPGVQLPHNLDGIGMLAFAVLDHLVGMAAGAILGRDHGSDGNFVFLLTIRKITAAVIFFVVLGHVLIPGLGQVTVQAGDVGIGVAAVGPVAEQAGVGLLVALDAGRGLGRNAALDAVLLHLGVVGLRPGRQLHRDQHQQCHDNTGRDSRLSSPHGDPPFG